MIEDQKVNWDEMHVVCKECKDDIFLLSTENDILPKESIEYYIKWCDIHKCKKGYIISTYRLDEKSEGSDISLTEEEFDHIAKKKGKCGCDLCYKFKSLLNDKFEE